MDYGRQSEASDGSKGGWSVGLPICLCISFYLSVYLLYLSVRLSIYLSIYLFVYLFVCLSICPSVYLSVYLSICLSASLKKKLFCETAFNLEVDNINDAAIQNGQLSVELTSHLSKGLHPPRKSEVRP